MNEEAAVLEVKHLMIALVVACAAPAFAHPGRALADAVAAADLAFFGALFERCDIEALSPMLSEDFEFFHDKWGQIAKTKAEFLTAIGGRCERQRAGTDFRSRRTLVPGSVRVYPIKDVGAFQTGSHRFFKVTPGKRDQLTERSRFAHLWRHVEGQWRLARVVSYAHVDAIPAVRPR